MDFLSLFLIFIALELFESNWQKSDTLHGVLYNNYSIYQKGIIYFFLLNPSFIYSIFLVIFLQNNGFLMLSIVGLKFLDIAFKLNLLTKMAQGVDLQEIMPNIQMNFIFRYMNALIYPLTFLFAVSYF
ncbi:hypothetical protein [Arcobacter arenosus]|uniref:Uncharacterized protein n=1 Tax=Arcobacter arenosus TaxID=2576037 RepID=A0A5R8XZL3_9BACT|nr:hypothetical protein [Arcobacter arenosus]TLP37088.1 hypothetical protein FDK22_12660 [Arcobacter arenosus]